MKIKLLLLLLAISNLINHAMADKLPPEVIQQRKFSKLIIGKWGWVKGLVLSYSTDGSYAIDSDGVDGAYAIVHEKGRWRIEGNQLIMDFSGGRHTVSQIEYMRDDSFSTQGRHHPDVFERISH